MNTNTFIVRSDVGMHHAQMLMAETNKKRRLLSLVPNLGTAVLEELKEFWYHNVEGSVQSVAVQQLRRVFADLLQCSKRALRHGHTQRGCQIERKHTQDRRENETASENKTEAWVLNALHRHLSSANRIKCYGVIFFYFDTHLTVFSC